MTIRVKRSGTVYEDAGWFGFNFWIRARTKGGWLHWAASEVDIIN